VEYDPARQTVWRKTSQHVDTGRNTVQRLDYKPLYRARRHKPPRERLVAFKRVLYFIADINASTTGEDQLGHPRQYTFPQTGHGFFIGKHRAHATLIRRVACEQG